MPVLQRHPRQHRRGSHHAGLRIHPNLRPAALGLVFLGGAAGTFVRAEVGHWLPHSPFSWATFAVNMAGAFLLGALTEALAQRPDDERYRRYRLLLGTGFCGGLTTYSAFALDIHDAAPAMGALYAGSTILLGLVAAFAGAAVVRR
ncbi:MULTISPECIES: fluoride efflux transporter FluC [Tsukamurella]|uniref:Fluoride-specific ion channel FluC n=1 Tax=Tsukamurella strandjordii TaxID=147577 RepID=A0AA90NS96_9ACTN|nr:MULTISPECIES: CrcB family protein [Tsukamurella]MDP0399889.1 CrcB family protein [Tsukamurella strandjordii]